MSKITYAELMDLSAERIQPYLPEDYEMDDMSYDEDGAIFQICVFDVSTPDPKGPADRFRFYRQPGETEDEMMDRWDREVQDFAESWAEVR